MVAKAKLYLVQRYLSSASRRPHAIGILSQPISQMRKGRFDKAKPLALHCPASKWQRCHSIPDLTPNFPASQETPAGRAASGLEHL